MEKKITSVQNPFVKEIIRLQKSGSQRMRSKRFFCEGARLCMEALEAGLVIYAVLATKEAADQYIQEWEALRGAAQECYIVSQAVANKISQTTSSQGIFALVDMLDNWTDTATISNDGKIMLLQDLQDPGNVGTIIRTGAAFGIDGIGISRGSVDVYSSKVLRSTMGALFRVPVFRYDALDEIVRRLRQKGLSIYAAVLCEDAILLPAADLSAGTAVVIGNEGRGLTAEEIACCDGALQIPISQCVESLNAAVAASVIMWEMKGRYLQYDRQ